MDEFEIELKMGFLEESEQNIDDTEQAFLDLESNRNDHKLIDKIFRLAHNLKGTSRAVGFGIVAEFTHEMENLILKIKNAEVEVTDDVVSLLLECNDVIRNMIQVLKDNFDAKVDYDDTLNKIKMLLESNPVGSELNDASTPEVTNKNQQENEILSSELKQSETDTKYETTLEPTQNLTAPSAPLSSNPPSSEKKMTSTTNADDNIRVSLSRLEQLNNFVGELVILQTVLNQHGKDSSNPMLSKSLRQLEKLSKEIHELSMSLRMIPIRPTIKKLQRVVRDTSKTLNKQVNFHVFGEETEVDKTVLESLFEPLVHVVRNAIDHGLEETIDRPAVGKSEIGNVTIRCKHEGNNLVIEVQDDGKGIDPQKIRESAIKKNVIRESDKLTERELINLIFSPGFSTKQEVSEISGRGVGMDVVKFNIQELSGDIIVDSEIGKGSCFRIVLPLTMAVIDGMIAQVGSEKYVFPLAQIQETLKPKKEAIHITKGTGQVLNLRGETLPLLSLNYILKRSSREVQPEEQIAIIVKQSDGSCAFLVDDIFSQQQIVIKKLGDEIKNKQGFMGSSILGDGLPAIILDLHEIANHSVQFQKGRAA